MPEQPRARVIAPPLGLTGAKSSDLVNTLSLSSRRSKAELRKHVAARFVAAREMNGHTQVVAASLFGYKTSAQLNQWETGKRMPPLEMIVRAGLVYRVSIDYLLGVCMDPDRDPASEERMHLLRGAESALHDMAVRLAEAIVYQTNLGGPSVFTAARIVQGGRNFLESFQKFRRLNTAAYEDLRGGASLDAAAAEMEQTLVEAKAMLEKNQRINEAALKGVIKNRKPTENYPLFEALAHTG